MTTNNHILLQKSNVTGLYRSPQAITYDFHLLLLLLDEQIATKNDCIDFYKNSSILCWTTDQVFLNKNGKNIELFDIHDLIDNKDLSLPKSPKFVLSIKNFGQMIMQWKKLYTQRPETLFLVIDHQKIVHLTTDLATINPLTFFSLLRTKFNNLFIRTQ